MEARWLAMDRGFGALGILLGMILVHLGMLLGSLLVALEMFLGCFAVS